VTTRFELATLRLGASPVGVIKVGERYWRLDKAAPTLPTTIKGLLSDWEDSFPKLQALADACAKGGLAEALVTDTNPVLETPILYPNKLVAVGANYADHLREMGMTPAKWDVMPFFFKPPTTAMVGPGKTMPKPASTQQFDWEIELAVVIGKKLKNASREEARAGIAGYSVGLDMSCRDLQTNDTPVKLDLARGKAQDAMGPMGPTVVPAAFIKDPHNLSLRLSVNGELKQNGTTSDMLFQVDEMASEVSKHVTLEPGDVLFTGSCRGAGASIGQFLNPGDEIVAEIGEVGTLVIGVT
jgi:2-keto-4-pentenoate hydratase/2-oxohepta-3-ene-1,7-dioic acid hydratase in catechol pathway